MQKMTKTQSGREIIVPASEEDADITAAAISDPDAHPLSDAELALLRPARGRPKAAIKRPMLSMRVGPDVLAKVRYPRKGEQYPGLSASQAQLPRVQLKGHIAHYATFCSLWTFVGMRTLAQRCAFQGLMTARPAASKGPESRVATVKPWTVAIAAM